MEADTYRSFFENAIEGMCRVTPAGRFLVVNPAMAAMLGYASPEDLVSTIQDVRRQIYADPERRAEHLRILAEHGAAFSFEFEAVRKDDRHVWISASSRAVRDAGGSILYYEGTVRDITRHKLLEMALQESEERFRLIAETIHEVFWMSDVEIQTVYYVSPAYERIWGRSRESLYRDPRSFLDAVHPEDRARVVADLELQKSGQAIDHEYRIIRPDGSMRWIWDRGFPVPEPSGKVRRCLGVAQDITARRDAADALAHAIARADADRIKSEFLRNMSHEFRTPLNGILGMTQLVLDTPLTSEQHECLEAVRDCGEALAAIVGQILDFAEIDAGQRGLNLAACDLRRTAADVVSLFRPGARQKHLELRCDIAPGVPESVMVDAARLRQVLVNLVGNAIRFTEAGSVVIAIASMGAEQLHFSVSDTGIGIARENQQRIFEPFEQVDNSRSRRFTGPGLGLSIASRIVELMGGRLSVESEPGRGSAFHFTLSVADPRSSSASPPG